ncbi:MAG: hypothetical protein GX593_12105 [Actinomycetales bacterium]|nr:hypothetical protein [Actinomycetales bacterium]
MLWFSVWTVLVAGTLVGAFFLGRDVLRRGGRLMTALEEASGVVATLESKVAELDSLRTEPKPYAPDAATARKRREELRELGEERARKRHEKRLATIESWRQLTR